MKIKKLIKRKQKIYISTWQSMQKMTPDYFKQFNALMIDECHGATAKEIQTISKKCSNAFYRIGLSATYPDERSLDWFSIVGAMGPTKRYTNYKELREKKRVAGLKIKDVFLKHPLAIARDNFEKNSKNFMQEIEYINDMEHRDKFISMLVGKLKGNTIVLFTRIVQGKNIEKALKLTGNKKVLYVDGDVHKDDREQVRVTMENNDNIVSVVSYGTFSQGVSIKNIHNIVLAANYKSKIKVIQSIGRGLRINDSKDQVTVYDLIDDLEYSYIENTRVKKYLNYGLKHYKERKKFYKEEGYDDITQTTVPLIL